MRSDLRWTFAPLGAGPLLAFAATYKMTAPEAWLSGGVHSNSKVLFVFGWLCVMNSTGVEAGHPFNGRSWPLSQMT